MTKKEWENMTEEEASELYISHQMNRELLRPEIIIERAEIIIDPEKRIEFVAAKSERLREIKSGESLNKILKITNAIKVTHHKEGEATREETSNKIYNSKDLVLPFQFAGIFEASALDTENFISACKERLFYEDETTHVITDNYVERLTLEQYLNELYSQADQIPELMNIGGKIDFLICAKYRKEWLNASKYNPEFDKRQPFDAAVEIQKRIDELKAGYQKPQRQIDKIKWCVPNKAALIDIFFQMQNAGIIESTKTNINHFINQNFVDSEGKEFTPDYIEKYLKPRTNKSGYDNGNEVALQIDISPLKDAMRKK
jgi:hypothetical protein